jgi:hypothetical protein
MDYEWENIFMLVLAVLFFPVFLIVECAKKA